MNVNIYNQFYNVLIFIITGIVIGILFDSFRILRRSFKTPDIITFIEDIIFWILVGVILLFSIFNFNNGEIRSYIFVGLGIGIITYILTISKYFIKISVKILVTIKNIIYFPFKQIFKFCQKFIFHPIWFIILKVKQFLCKTVKIPSKSSINDNFTKNCNKIEQ